MIPCNAWYGYPDPEAIHYRCQLPKGHSGKHYVYDGELEIMWQKDNRPRMLAVFLIYHARSDNISKKRKRQKIETANKILEKYTNLKHRYDYDDLIESED